MNRGLTNLHGLAAAPSRRQVTYKAGTQRADGGHGKDL
jgi:hypothetical protein